jgi:hypothetical protein
MVIAVQIEVKLRVRGLTYGTGIGECGCAARAFAGVFPAVKVDSVKI